MIMNLRGWWNKRSIGSKLVVILGLSIFVGQGLIIARQAIEEDRWRHDSAMEVNRILAVLMANQAGRAIENGDEADLEAIYFDVAYNDAGAKARSEIAALYAYSLELKRIKSYVSLDHLGIEEAPLRNLAVAAQNTKELAYANSDGLAIYAVPVFSPRDRTLVGTLTVAWDTSAIDAQTHSALITHVSLSAFTAIAVLGLLLFVLRLTVAKPLSRLTERVLAVKKNDYFDEEHSGLATDRDDEIGVLFREFDRMMWQLADARRRLLEQSYQAGVAESVAGVLHNLRNTLHPIASASWSLRRLSKPPQVAYLHSALGELAGEDTPPERRGKLTEYVQKSLERTTESYASMGKQVDVIASQVAQAERILFSFGLKTKTSAQLIIVDMRLAVEDAAHLVRQKPGAEMIHIEVDESVKSAPPVRGQEVILLQLLGNLFVNAYEAIAAAGKVEYGHIKVSARQEKSGEQTMLILEVRDNGQGIAPADLERVFESGFSTRSKKSGGGIGLHWCANSAIAMGGQLTAASDGPGTGAIFYLRLPVATDVALTDENTA